MLLSMSVSVFAYDFSKNPGLYWLASNSKYTLYLNIKTLKYDPATDSIEFYRTEDCPSEGFFLVTKTRIDYSKNLITGISQTQYFHNNDTKFINRGPSPTEDIIPDTWGETMKNVSAKLVNRDEKLAAYKKEQEQKKAEAEEKAKSERKKEQIKQVAGSVLGGLGGLF